MVLGLGLSATAPAVRRAREALKAAGGLTGDLGGAAYERLPEPTREVIRSQVETFAESGRTARTETIESVVGGVVAEVMASDAVRTALSTAVEGAVQESLTSPMYATVDRVRDEISQRGIDEMVRASVERVLPQVLEQDLTNALVNAARLPARTAFGLARLPGTMSRARQAESVANEPDAE